MTTPNRRTVLKLLGSTATLTGAVGSASARPRDTSLRLFAQEPVDGAMETVTQGRYAYVANGTGMAVIDWRNPGQPTTVAEVDLDDELENPSLSIKDVKVEGDVAALANDTENPGGIALYDVSDPTDPQFRSFYEPEPPANIHNCHVEGDYAYLALGEPLNVDTDGDGDRDKVWIFGDAGIEIVDVSDPSNPTHASTWYLKEYSESYAKAGTNPCHDLYAQDGLVYGAFWDAGTIALDVSDPTDPQFVTQFGAAPNGDVELARPWLPEEESFGEWAYQDGNFPLQQYLSPPGNAHYVQPSPDGDHVYVGAETFLGDPGGIDVWDVSDLSSPTKVGRIDPPENISGLHTSHNFDVTANRLHASWYLGGTRVYDVTDPANPTEIASYNPDGVSFWTAVAERGFTIGGVYGAMSEQGGITVLHEDRGEMRPPAFSGAEPPNGPEVDAEERT